ncbi:metallophosphoesterase family protein [Sporolactobacillus vineae]|uniref:metallophosphoesterase family protein n=1 Tax=Sporolactobacillus vineae TaxID=444463 RepID=UPI00028A1CAA|nr:DNA repair exonuclease [Sporolactobacillus vineae]
MSFTFIHAADIHLDSPLIGLEHYEGAPVERIRSATRDAFVNLIDQAITRKVAFLIIAGDLYDGDWKDYNTGLFFTSQMVRLQKAGIRVFLIRGNHDAASLISRELKLPDNVSEFPTDHAETDVIEELKVAVHGQGFASRSVEENLVKGYPERREGYFNIGVLHTSATGREGHENYAPCSVDDMIEKGYDYWALGHIHKRELLHPKDPVILFSGNIQGRHINETGEKGCTLVSVQNGTVDTLTELPLDVLRWERCDLDATGMTDIEAMRDSARTLLEERYRQAGGRLLAVRFQIHGITKLHQELIVREDYLINNIRSLALEVGSGDIWVEKVKIETTDPVSLAELTKQDTPVAAILNTINRMSADEATLHQLLDAFQDLKQALPFELKNGNGGFSFDRTEFLKKRLPDVEDLILYYLSHPEMSVS